MDIKRNSIECREAKMGLEPGSVDKNGNTQKTRKSNGRSVERNRMMEAKKKILVVDDDATNNTIMEELLGEDYDLKIATTGEVALKTALDFLPDLILLDIMMPGMDGYQVCRRLRACPPLWGTKVIMVTAKATLEDRIKGRKVGVDDYIVKPFEEECLLEAVRFFL